MIRRAMIRRAMIRQGDDATGDDATGEATAGGRHRRVHVPPPRRSRGRRSAGPPPDRPAFDRPALANVSVGIGQSAPTTVAVTAAGVRPGARAEGLPGERPGERTHLRRRPDGPPKQSVPQPRPPRFRRTAIGLITVAVAGLVVATCLWFVQRGQHQRSKSTGSASRISAATTPSVSLAAASGAPTGSNEQIQAVLLALAVRRQQAYAAANPALLVDVYAPGPLLTQDQQQLRRLVPTGCSMVGVYVDYSSVQVESLLSSATVLEATAALAPSQLICGSTITAGRRCASHPAANRTRPPTRRFVPNREPAPG